jgi:hypothetical protein
MSRVTGVTGGAGWGGAWGLPAPVGRRPGPERVGVLVAGKGAHHPACIAGHGSLSTPAQLAGLGYWRSPGVPDARVLVYVRTTVVGDLLDWWLVAGTIARDLGLLCVCCVGYLTLSQAAG